MIQSAQVFTPRPDPDPRVNLRVLQTPIRLNSSPLKHAHHTFKQEQDDQQDGEDGTPIRLVEGNRPQVVEEEQDLVILEEVDAPETSAQPQATQHVQSPVHAPQAGAAPGFPLAPSHQSQQFQTPRRRLARPSLHRAVLIRSAQRAAMRFEMEEEEEREVEEHVTPIEEQMEVDEEYEGDQDAVIEEFNEEAGEDTEPDSKPIFGWRKSLDAFKSSLQALRSPSRSPERDEYMEQDIAEVNGARLGCFLVSDWLVLFERLTKMPRSILLVMEMNPWTEMMNCKSPRMKRAWVMHLMETKPDLKASLLTRMHRLLINSPPNARNSVSIL